VTFTARTRPTIGMTSYLLGFARVFVAFSIGLQKQPRRVWYAGWLVFPHRSHYLISDAGRDLVEETAKGLRQTPHMRHSIVPARHKKAGRLTRPASSEIPPLH
jgi:hypothetical protein